MYQVINVEDEIAVPPAKFDKDLDTSIMESIGEKIEGKIDNQMAVIL